MMTDPPAVSKALYRLITLGPPMLLKTDAEGERVIYTMGKPLALVIYLSMLPGRSARREHLSAVLWGNSTTAKGLAALRQVLWQLRDRLGDAAVVSSDRNVSLNIDLTVDEQECLAAFNEGDFARVVELYTNEFLPDFAIPGAAELEIWADGERQRLRSAYLMAGESTVRCMLDESHFSAASHLAHRLRDSDPLSERLWRLLLETLAAVGDTVEMRLEIERLESMLGMEEREPEPATRDLIQHLRARPDARLTEDDTSHSLVAELIGREKEFSAVIEGWRKAKAGQPTHFHITGRPGVGKTRLLDDVHARLDAEGARTVYVRAHHGERAMTFALAGDLADALAQLPGAAGISSGSVSQLLHLAPTLSNIYSARQPATNPTEQGAMKALSELLLAVADEGPFAILVDDLHWADRSSIVIVQSLIARLEGVGTLIVTTQRPPTEPLPAPFSVALELNPLSSKQLQQMLESLGLRRNSWSRAMTDILHSVTEGIPFLVLEILRLALDRGLLLLDRSTDAWICPDEDALRRELLGGTAEEQRIARLTEREQGVLLSLTVAGIPLHCRLIESMLQIESAECLAQLRKLERDGFVVQSNSRWAIAHDKLAESILTGTDSARVAEIRGALANAAVAIIPDPETLRLATLQLEASGDNALLQVAFGHWLSYWRGRGDRRSVRQLAAALIGVDVRSSRVRALVSSLPLRRRFRYWSVTTVGTVAVVALVVVTGVAVTLGLRSNPPYRLMVTSTPSGLASDVLTMMPAPAIEIRHRDGTLASELEDTIRVSRVLGPNQLTGTLAVVAVGGRAVFDRIRPAYPGSSQGIWVLRFESSWGTVQTDSFEVNYPPSLHFASGSINGYVVDRRALTISVGPGDSLVGTVDLRYSTNWGAASIVLGMSSTWESREEVAPGRALATPVRNGLTRDMPINLRAPSEPGTYHVIFAFAAEENTKHVFSGTNWTYGEPVWHDGNDIVDWPDSILGIARTTGTGTNLVLWPDYPRHRNTQVAAAVLDVIVR